jgi:hypothetical protein
LPKASWTHRAHFAFALWVVTRRSDLDATRAVPEAIRRYNESTGVANTDTGGYHETITQASLRAARAFAHECGTPLYQTCNALMRSPLGTSDWLLAYWSRERLFSVEARRSWVDADRAPFPYAASPIIER